MKATKNGGGVASLIRKGISYSFRIATFNPRDLTTEWDSLVVYPFAGVTFAIRNLYRPPSTNADNIYRMSLYAESFSPSILSPPISNCLVLGDFNLELKDPPSCLADANLSEWDHVRNIRDITDGEGTCIPPHNTDDDFEPRAIDLALIDVDSVPNYGWGRIGAFSSDRAPILISLGGVSPPINEGRSTQRYDFANADWGKYRSELERKLGNFHVIGNITKGVRGFTRLILDCADSAISKTSPRGVATNFFPPEAKRLQRERELEYAKYRNAGSDEAREKMEELSREISESVSESKRTKWREFCKKTDYNSDPKAAMRVTKSLSGITYQEQRYGGITDPSFPGGILWRMLLKHKLLANIF